MPVDLLLELLDDESYDVETMLPDIDSRNCVQGISGINAVFCYCVFVFLIVYLQQK